MIGPPNYGSGGRGAERGAGRAGVHVDRGRAGPGHIPLYAGHIPSMQGFTSPLCSGSHQRDRVGAGVRPTRTRMRATRQQRRRIVRIAILLSGGGYWFGGSGWMYGCMDAWMDGLGDQVWGDYIGDTHTISLVRLTRFGCGAQGAEQSGCWLLAVGAALPAAGRRAAGSRAHAGAHSA